MQTDVDEVADGVYRLSTWIEPAGLVFNQYLLDAEQPLLFHTGQRNLFPLVREAVATVMAPGPPSAASPASARRPWPSCTAPPSPTTTRPPSRPSPPTTTTASSPHSPDGSGR